MSKIKPSIVKILGYVILIVSLVVIVRGWIGYRPVIIISGSMEPEYKTNCIAIVKKSSLEEIGVGDVIVYRYRNMKISHRVIEKAEDSKGEYLITKGDANRQSDDVRVSKDMIEGKIIKHSNVVVPLISHLMITPGRLNPLAVTQLLLMVIVIVTIIFKILEQVVKLKGYIKEELKKKDREEAR